MIILAWIVSTGSGAEPQCTTLPTETDAMNAVPDLTDVDTFNITCTAISTEQPPSGMVYYRKAAAIVSSESLSITSFFLFECLNTSWTGTEAEAPVPRGPVTTRTDCYQCQTGMESDPATLCSRKCECMQCLARFCTGRYIYIANCIQN